MDKYKSGNYIQITSFYTRRYNIIEFVSVFLFMDLDFLVIIWNCIQIKPNLKLFFIFNWIIFSLNALFL